VLPYFCSCASYAYIEKWIIEHLVNKNKLCGNIFIEVSCTWANCNREKKNWHKIEIVLERIN